MEIYIGMNMLQGMQTGTRTAVAVYCRATPAFAFGDLQQTLYRTNDNSYLRPRQYGHVDVDQWHFGCFEPCRKMGGWWFHHTGSASAVRIVVVSGLL
jgi:hypothetical protein